jgi:capsid protein
MIAEKLDTARQRQAELELASIDKRNRYLESTLDLYDRLVDFDAELFDPSGRQIWSKIPIEGFGSASIAIAYTTESEFGEVRNEARWLALQNEFAINGHENRISYIVGEGHEYTIEAKPGQEPADELVIQVREWFAEWRKENRWHKRQQEIVRRRDRDGEAFLRYFPDGQDGMLRVRFVEPEKVKDPEPKPANSRIRFGIEFDADDAETPVAYYIDKEPVDAAEIQHRKANVDLASPRGLPLFYPVRKNLRRAEKQLESLSILGDIRARLAWIVKHKHNQTAVQTMLDGKTDVKVTTAKGGESNYQRYRPGTMAHVPEDTKYEWPPTPDLQGYVVALQAELRAVASRLVMPEFMLTSDASNANYSSTMVAEGPAVKMFEREQADMIADDEEVIGRAVEHAVTSGRLPGEALDQVQITATGPSVRTRDRLKDAQADQILINNKAMSLPTLAARHQLDYEHEKEEIEAHSETETGFGVKPFGGQDDENPLQPGEANPGRRRDDAG